LNSTPDNSTSVGKPSGFLVFAAGLGLLLALRFDGIILGHDAFTLRDFSMFGYPLAAHLQASLFAGELPHWNPLNQAGVPFLAQWNTMTLYPPMWLAVMLPLSWSLSVFCIAHLYLGGLGMFKLAERFTRDPWAAALAGVAFAGNGLVQNSLMWPNNIAALGWMPWVLLLIEAACRNKGRVFYAAALVAGMQMLTGGPEVILLTWMLAGGMVLVQAWHHGCRGGELRWRIQRLFGVGALVCLLAAAQLLPFKDLLLESHRGVGFADGEWSASPMAWARFFTPLFYAIEAPGRIFYDGAQSWTHSFYAGLPVLALACVVPFILHDRRLWIAAGAALACLLLAMGAQGFIQPWLAKVPPFSLLRFPVKYLIPLVVLLPLLAAIGFAQIRHWDDSSDSEHCPKRVSVILGVVALGWLAAFLLGWNPPRMQQSDWISNGVARGVALALMGGFVWFLIRRKFMTQVSVAALVVIGLDLAFHQPNLAPTVPATAYRATTDQLAELKSAMAAQHRAAITMNAGKNLNANSLPSLEATQMLRTTALLGNANLSVNVAQVNGFYSLQLPRFLAVQSALHVGDDSLHAPVADFLGVSHVMYYSNMFHWLPRDGAMPLVTGGQEPIQDVDALGFMASTNFKPREQVLGNFGEAAQKADVAIADLKTSAHHIAFTAHASTNALVVVAQTFHKHWRATVNGTETRILRANEAFQAIAVPPGESQVELRYPDNSFYVGCVLSLLALAGCIAGLCRRQIV